MFYWVIKRFQPDFCPLSQQWCRITDSLFTANEDMCELVAAKEEQNQTNIEILKRALEMEKEAGRLKRQLKTENNVSSSEERKQASERPR